MYRLPLSVSIAIISINTLYGQLSYQIVDPVSSQRLMQTCQMTATVATVAANCACNGSATLDIQGGIAPYTIVWSNGETAESLPNLCAGTQLWVTVTDSEGCQAAQNTEATVADATAPIVLQSTDIVSPECSTDATGGATVHISGGLAPYSFTWKNSQNALIDFDSSIVNLAVGTYFLTITDQCQPTQLFTSAVEINNTSTLEITGVSTQIIGSNISATSSVVGGQTPYSYLWCNNSISETATYLQNGLCELEVTDAAGCTQTYSFLIDEPFPDSISIDKMPSCASTCDGEATVQNISLGQPPLQYSWSSGEVSRSAVKLCSGINYVTIIDANGIQTIHNINILGPEPIQVNTIVSSPTASNLSDGSIQVVASGGMSPYSYQWNIVGQNDSIVTQIDGGQYSVIITDANGCDTLIVVTLGNGSLTPCLVANSILTPNGDGSNDFLYVACIEETSTFDWVQISVFNRWGQQVFGSLRYDNTWAGTDKYGQTLPTGSYYIVAEGLSSTMGIMRQISHINLFRNN